MPRPGASSASAPGLASSHRHRSSVPLATLPPPGGNELLGQRLHVLELVDMALASPHVPTLAGVLEPTPPDDLLGAVRALADVGRSVDHPPTLAWLCEEPRSEVAGLGHLNRHPKLSRRRA